MGLYLSDEQESRRLKILGVENPEYVGHDGITHLLHDVSLESCEAILDESLTDPNDRQNNSPNFLEFVEFMRQYPQTKAIGYIVSPDRADARITIDGLECKDNITDELKLEFKKRFKEASEFKCTKKHLRCWYD